MRVIGQLGDSARRYVQIGIVDQGGRLPQSGHPLHGHERPLMADKRPTAGRDAVKHPSALPSRGHRMTVRGRELPDTPGRVAAPLLAYQLRPERPKPTPGGKLGLL